jgi:DNA-binding CsgD family transcriptional regulator
VAELLDDLSRLVAGVIRGRHAPGAVVNNNAVGAVGVTYTLKVKNMPRPLLPLDMDDIIERYVERRQSCVEIGRTLGIHPRTISSRLEAAGTPMRSQREVAALRREREGFMDPVDVLHRYFDLEQSTVEIAAALGRNPRTVNAVIHRAGKSTRTNEAAAQIRWERMTPEQRTGWRIASEKGHATIRGKPRSAAALTKQARTNELSLHLIGRGEAQFIGWLRERGADPLPQHPFGPYNIDAAILPVAVEILHGPHSPLAHAQALKKTKYLTNWGLTVLWVWIPRRGTLTERAADYAVALLELSQRHPSTLGHYRVIRGSGELVAAGGADGQEFPLVPAFVGPGQIAV